MRSRDRELTAAPRHVDRHVTLDIAPGVTRRPVPWPAAGVTWTRSSVHSSHGHRQFVCWRQRRTGGGVRAVGSDGPIERRRSEDGAAANSRLSGDTARYQMVQPSRAGGGGGGPVAAIAARRPRQGRAPPAPPPRRAPRPPPRSPTASGERGHDGGG